MRTSLECGQSRQKRARPKKSEEWKEIPTSIDRAGFNRIMSKEAPLSNAERDFILEALREDVRLDGRNPDQFRPLSVSFGDEYGHVKLQLGKTRLVLSMLP